ncbi:MAG TPA: hypothetical protein VKP66_08475 [Steroidobacteraceae bacterium]|nr:hypothetical protein [Steroidobacteraceae bacterium]
MENRKPFDPMDIDESLTRLITHAGHTYLLFPYINATGMTPKFNSIGRVIGGSSATAEDIAALSAQAKQAADRAEWFISFNTPWLVTAEEADAIRQRRHVSKQKRVS